MEEHKMRSKYKVVSPEVGAMLDALKSEGAANRAALEALKAEGGVNRAALDALRAESKVNRAELQAEDYSKRHREWTSIVVQILTLVVLTATLVAVFLQVREMMRAYAPLQQQAVAAIQSAAAATTAADNARRASIVSNRPWVKVSVLPGSRPISLDGQGQLNVPIDFVLTNVGHSPAMSVQVAYALYFYGSPAFASPGEVLRKTVNEWKRRHENSELVLFPGESVRLRYVATSDPIDKMKWMFPMNGALSPAIVGTVAYYTQLDDLTHQTTFGLAVERRAPTHLDIVKKRSANAIFLDEGIVPASNVRFEIDPIDGSYAN